MSLQIYLLGKSQIFRDGNPINLPGYRPLALLAYLIVERKSHRREHLVDLFFDGSDDPRASLRWTLFKLRKAIGREYILGDREEISFNFQSDYWLDLSDFEAGELDLFQGDFLEGLHLRDAFRFDEWLLFERQRYRGQFQAGLEGKLEMYQGKGDFAAVVLTSHELLNLDILREDWHYALMEAYARLGKRTTALKQFEKCRQVLRTKLDAEPAPETVILAEAIQNGQFQAEIPALESGSGRFKTISAQEEQGEELAVNPKIRRRPGIIRMVFRVMGTFGLLLVFLLFGFRELNLNRLDVVKGGASPAISSNTTSQGASPQEFAGTQVTILGPLPPEYTKLLERAMQPLETRSGIDVVTLPGGGQYDTDLANRLKTGHPPDIVAFPQPGFLAEYAKQGKIIDLRSFLADTYLRHQYPDSFLDMATIDGKMMGVWYTVGLKSLVWYPKQAFEAKGYKVPNTWDELLSLSNRIVADGGVPWCIGIKSGDFTGWVGTDWVEDILLRTASAYTYDAWVKHDLPFNSPEIRKAFEIMGQIWLNDDYVYGGTANILNESWDVGSSHLFEDPPECYLYKQGSWAPLSFPKTARFGKDYDFFTLPSIDPEFDQPVLGSGDIFAMFNDRPEVREVMRYLTTAESARALIENGGYLSPLKDTPIGWYPSAADLRFAQIVLGAGTYRFDASDMMPKEVGEGSFYKGIIDWVKGADLDAVLREIDAGWDR